MRAGRIFAQWALQSAYAQKQTQQTETPDWKKLLDASKEWPVKVWDETQNSLVTMPLETYVAGVVAAEMPASYHLEALKAQAAAARTKAVCQSAAFGGTGCANHPGADICTNSSHCQAYIGEKERAEKWGASAAAYEARILRAVVETRGYILTYEGEPITVLYHAVSGGQTEDVKAVFSQALPYLVSVKSPGEESNPKYQTQQAFSNTEAAELLNKAFPGANISPDTIALQLAITKRTDTGRAAMVQVGDVTVPASELRSALKLNSTFFTIAATESTVTFSEKGYGHGVGMSQAGPTPWPPPGLPGRRSLRIITREYRSLPSRPNKNPYRYNIHVFPHPGARYLREGDAMKRAADLWNVGRQRLKKGMQAYSAFMEKQGFYLVLTICVLVIVGTAVWTRASKTPERPPPPTPARRRTCLTRAWSALPM